MQRTGRGDASSPAELVARWASRDAAIDFTPDAPRDRYRYLIYGEVRFAVRRYASELIEHDGLAPRGSVFVGRERPT